MNATGKIEFERLEFDGKIAKFHPPYDASVNRVFLLLHGHTGDENSMGIFSRNLPQNSWIVAPRGFYATNEGGYKWITAEAGLTASIVDFQNAARALFLLFSNIKSIIGIPEAPLDVIGFSQGAVMALSFALTFPGSVRRAASLSGFLPSDTMERVDGRPLSGLPIYVAHGTEDKTVTIDRARDAIRWLNQLGATVTTCEAPVTHRISANCFRGFSEFFQ